MGPKEKWVQTRNLTRIEHSTRGPPNKAVELGT